MRDVKRPKPPVDRERFLTTAEVASWLNVPEGTLRWWRHTGYGPKAFRLGQRKVMYRESDVTAWLNSRLETTSAAGWHG
jgi:predicted DNA-binding transcriptional regulator AlpA